LVPLDTHLFFSELSSILRLQPTIMSTLALPAVVELPLSGITIPTRKASKPKKTKAKVITTTTATLGKEDALPKPTKLRPLPAGWVRQYDIM
jgi:hypothetical protein